MRGRASDCVCCTQGNFALRGEFLSARAERNQRAAKGWAQDGRSAPIFAHPLDPHYGGYPLNIVQPFRRVKSEWLAVGQTDEGNDSGGVVRFPS